MFKFCAFVSLIEKASYFLYTWQTASWQDAQIHISVTNRGSNLMLETFSFAEHPDFIAKIFLTMSGFKRKYFLNQDG